MTVPLTAHRVVSQLIAQFGHNWSRDIAQACERAYAPLHTPGLEPGVVAQWDVPYGPHPRQQLDVYRPASPGPHPVLIFFHGGGLNSGDKRLPDTGERFYNNIGRYFARHGVVALIANYRLVPDACFPAGGEDVALAVRWAKHQVSSYGGDPSNITLFGNSAGGVHVATYLFRFWQPGEIRRAVLFSVPCTMPEGGPREPVTSAYYGSDLARRAAHQPLGLLRSFHGPKPPILFMTAQYDPPEILEPCQAFAAEYADKFGPLDEQVIPHHNHITGVLSLNTDDAELGQLLLTAIAQAE